MLRAKLSPSTILALQAAIAIALCFLVGNFFQLERSYWAVLTALLLISQTWGESLKKAFERVSMTILGGILGTLIYFTLNDYPLVLFIIMMFTVFFMIYFIGYSFRASAFFITMFVVFLFAMLGSWNIHFLEIRIYETIIGASIAVATTIIFFPSHAKSDLRDLSRDYIKACKDVLQLSFDIGFEDADKNSINPVRDKLFKNFLNLSETFKTSSYEMLFTIVPRKKARVLMNEFNVLLHYVTSVLETSPFIDPNRFDTTAKNSLNTIKENLLNNLKNIIALMDEQQTSQPLVNSETQLDELAQRIVADLQVNKENQGRALHSLSFIYYLEKINDVLIGLQDQLLSM